MLVKPSIGDVVQTTNPRLCLAGQASRIGTVKGFCQEDHACRVQWMGWKSTSTVAVLWQNLTLVTPVADRAPHRLALHSRELGRIIHVGDRIETTSGKRVTVKHICPPSKTGPGSVSVQLEMEPSDLRAFWGPETEEKR